MAIKTRQDSAEIPRSRAWWTVVGSALALTVSPGPIIQFSFAIFIKPLAAAFGTDRGTMALAPALALLVIAAATPLMGVLSDRWGLRRIVLPAILLGSATLALLGLFARSVPMFIFLYCVAAFFTTGFSALPHAKAIAGIFRSHRGIALGLSMAGIDVGTATVPLLSQLMITSFGWRNAYVGLAAIVLFAALPASYLTLPDMKGGRIHDTTQMSGFTPREAMRTATFWKIALAFMIVALSCSGIMAHVAALLTDRGISPARAATAISTGGVALIVGRILSGYLLDRVFAPHVTLGFFVTATLGVIVMVATRAPGLAWLATALVGLGLGAEIDLIAFLVTRYFGQRSFGAIYGYILAAFMVGTALGPLLMGMSFARTGSYVTTMSALVIGLVIACVLVARIGGYRFQIDGKPVNTSK